MSKSTVSLLPRLPEVVLALGLSACAGGPRLAPETPQGQSIGAGVSRIQREAQAVRPLAQGGWAAEYLLASERLPGVAPRRLGAESVDEIAYYYGGGESPVFFARLLDLLSDGETRRLVGRQLLELQAGAIGTLRMLAAAGTAAVGVNPSPRLQALYSLPGDQGAVPLFGREVVGQVRLISGQFPADPATRAAVSGGYDAVVAKNFLKRGYIHPTDAAPADTQVQLGVPDEAYLRSLFEVLRPGGRLLVYNLCPPPSPAGQPYNPHADCRNPFSQAMWQAAGFRVRDFDRNDTATARAFGQALGWSSELYATYTLLERP